MRLIIINIFVFCVGMTLVSSLKHKNNDMAQMFNNDDQLRRLLKIRSMQRSNWANKQQRDLVLSKYGAHQKRIHITRRDELADDPSAGISSPQPPIINQGGPVMNDPVVYLIWYGNWDDNSAIQIITNFVQYLGTTPWWNIVRAYGDIAPLVYRASTSDPYSRGTQLTDASIFSIVQEAIQSEALPNDTNGIYLVLTSSDCNQTEFFNANMCGWHNFDTDSNLKYGWVGNPEILFPTACAKQTVSPNGNFGADAMVNMIAHE
jgi:hypothetical protein